MKNVISLLIIFFFGFSGFAQNSDKLQKEQKKLEKKISQTKSLLSKVKKNATNSLSELKLLDNQIKSREALVRVFDNQVRVAETKVIEKENEVKRLYKRLSSLKVQYKKMLLFAYKKRNKTGKLMFLLSSNSYNEAIKRNSYLKKVADLQQKQIGLIKQHQGLIKKEIKTIKKEKSIKELALVEKKTERELITADKKIKEKNYSKFKKEEENLLVQLKADERKKDELKQRINTAIKQEIAATQERERKEAEKRRIEAEKNKVTPVKTNVDPKVDPKTTVTPKTETPKKVTPVKTETLSSEGSIIGKNFEANKGRLPSPVTGGSITERYGNNAHPTLPGVVVNNNGIDITCAAHTKVRAVFEGEVSAVINVSGAGKVVIIKHGNYRTVYSNLQESYVKTGDKISTKQSVGSLMLDEGNLSVLHFEVHVVNGTLIQSLNPSLWISR
jgi:hypothetical protein